MDKENNTVRLKFKAYIGNIIMKQFSLLKEPLLTIDEYHVGLFKWPHSLGSIRYLGALVTCTFKSIIAIRSAQSQANL